MTALGIFLEVTLTFLGLVFSVWNIGKGLAFDDSSKYKKGVAIFISTTGMLILISTIQFVLE